MDTTFIDELASGAPTPGGGGGSAYVGALAAALASMVGNLTVGKPKYAAYEKEVCALLDKLEQLRVCLLGLVEQDARAFQPLAAAYRLPKATPEEAQAKNAALQKALIGACEVPLEIMKRSAEVLDACAYLAEHGSRMALSDVGVSVVFARAAIEGASLNIFINAASLDDKAQAGAYRMQAQALIADAQTRCDSLFERVCAEIS